MNKWFKLVIFSSSLLGAWALDGFRMQSQAGTVPLASTRCIQSSGGIDAWRGPAIRDIPVGRELYTPLMSLEVRGEREAAAFTCKIRSDVGKGRSPRTLKLAFGRDDRQRNFSQDPIVSVFLDGNRATQIVLSSGELKTELHDVSRIKNIIVEAVCSNLSRGCPTVYFIEAELDMGARNPGKR